MTDTRSALDQLITGLNMGELEAIGDLVSHYFFDHSPGPDEPDGTAIFGRLYGDISRALPDLRLRIDALEQAEGTLTGSLHAVGTKHGSLWGSPPTGRTVEWTSRVSVKTKQDAKIALAFEDLSLPDVLGVLRELEVVNPPEDMDKPHRHPVEPPDDLLKLLFNGGAADPNCTHLGEATVFDPATDICAICAETGDIWPALRMCLICGYVGCCDTSKNRHAYAHFEESGHPLMRSIRLSEGWIWCYVDNAFFTKRTLDRLRGG